MNRTQSIPATRRPGAFDSRPIVYALAFGLAAWVVAILGFQALAGIVRGVLTIGGLS